MGIAVIAAYLAIALAGQAESTAGQKPWVKLFERNGISIFTASSPNQRVIAVRSEGVVEAPIAKVASVVFDCTRATEWSNDLKESRIERWFSPTEFLEYDRVGAPFFLFKERDFVTRAKIARSLDGYDLALTYRSVEDSALPETHNVRGEIHAFNGLRSIRGGAATYLVIEVSADPKGNIPTSIVNWAQRTFAVDYFEGLRKQAAKPDIKIPPQLAEAMAAS